MNGNMSPDSNGAGERGLGTREFLVCFGRGGGLSGAEMLVLILHGVALSLATLLSPCHLSHKRAKWPGRKG